MRTTLLYTFRTFPNISELKALELPLIVLRKPKEDLEKIKEFIIENKIERVIGIAKAKTHTRIESITINEFHGCKLSKTGSDFYRLTFLKGMNS